MEKRCYGQEEFGEEGKAAEGTQENKACACVCEAEDCEKGRDNARAKALETRKAEDKGRTIGKRAERRQEGA